MNRPPVDNARLVIEYIRGHRSVIYRRVPDDFLAWRLELRRQARLHGMRISVRRGSLGWVVENPDCQLSADDRSAALDLLSASIEERDLSYDKAVRHRARHRLRLVLPDEPHEPQPQWSPPSDHFSGEPEPSS